MNTLPKWILTLTASCVLSALTMHAASDAKSYQVTGPVLEVTPTTITVQKGEERWQIARDKNTKAPADIKVGAKVTVYYVMVATEIEAKEAKGKETKAKK